MYAKLVLALLLFLFAFVAALKAFYYWFTDIGDLYSNYRNKTDNGYPYFRRHLTIKRVFFTVVSLCFMAIGAYLLGLR